MITFLLGSGISIAAEMPGVGPMTDQVLSGENVIRYAGTFGVVSDDSPIERVAQDDPTLTFVRRLRDLVADFYKHFGVDRDVNYEEIAYAAAQLDDCVMFNYENPALLPLIEQLEKELGSEERLRELASDAVEYVSGVVWARLRRSPARVNHLTCITDACKDGPIGLISLNHDTVLEQALRHGGVSFKDGFTQPVSKEIDAWSNDFEANVKLFKLHGSVNWYRLSLDGRKTVVRTDADDPYHLKDDGGNQLDFPADARGQFLAGTFNKILAYQSPVYFEQQIGAFESMRDSSALVVIGYGFGDKAINTRIIDWLEATSHRLILVHRDPVSALQAARPALRDAIGRAAPRMQYATIEKWVQDASWEEIAETSLEA
ncbi:MAG: SIR2 family protein [Gaiellaceae bacterium]